MTMSVEITRALPDHVPAIARVMFAAFDAVSRRHGFEPEVFAPEVAVGMASAFVHRPDIWGVVAIDGGEVVGHNFVQLTDAVAGVGPICVDPDRQCGGVGRWLMTAVIDHTLAHHGRQIRLVQEAFNMASLGLYTSLGFDVKEPVVIMSVPPQPDDACRPLLATDVDEADALCVAVQKVSRRNELLGMIAKGPAMDCVPNGRWRGGELAGFVVPGFFGFGAAKTAEDLIAASRAAVARLPPPLRRIILPTRNGELLREAMRQGLRSVKVGQLMAIGPYEQPAGFWAPSIAY